MLNPVPNMCINIYACPDTHIHYTWTHTQKCDFALTTYPGEGRSIKTRINQSKTNTGT